jgi:apolipoprotein N-acyltransferase
VRQDPEHTSRRIAVRSGFVAALAGTVTGAGFGVEGGGWVVPLVLAVLVARLARPGTTPRHAAALLATYAAAACLAAHLGAALGVPAPWRVLAWLPLAVLLTTHAAGAAIVGAATRAGRMSPTRRWAVVLPSLWTALEAVLAIGDAAIPWLRTGYAQAADGPLSGALPYGGVLLAGWLTWSVAGLVGTATCGASAAQRCKAGVAAGGIVLLTMAAGQMQWTQPHGTLRVALLQPGTTLTAAAVTPPAVERLFDWYADRLREDDADLAVTPQLALPKTPASLPPGYLSQIESRLQARGADALIGLHLTQAGSPLLFNGVLGLGRSGPQVYLKQHLFPYGEFVPLAPSAAHWLQRQLPVPFVDTARGPRAETPAVAAGHRVAIAICWDMAYGDDWRLAAATADVLAGMSGDGTLDSVQLTRQSRQLARTRARELQKPLVRTSDVQGTFVVDHRGRVVDELPAGAQGVLHAVVLTRDGLTPYGRWGDALVWLWIAAALGGAFLTTLARRPASRHPVAIGGQVLPLAAVLLVVIGAALYLMVYTGQAVQQKMRVTNAADAAAYSAAVAEARALNHDAYLNRAIVANEIAIAQMVSYASWLGYFATASDQFAAADVDVNFFLLPNPRVAQLDAAFAGSAAVAAYLGGRRVSDIADEVLVAIAR